MQRRDGSIAVRHVYIYGDFGTSEASVEGWKSILTKTLKHPSDLITLTLSHTIIKDISRQMPEETLVIFPGGADKCYLERLSSEAILRIRAMVALGGSYIGTCAGAYFASRFCMFETENENLRVLGPRPLCLMGQTAIGAVIDGFQYGSETGARTLPLQCEWRGVTFTAQVYCNGGPAWIGMMNKNGTKVIARYSSAVLSRHGFCEMRPAAVIQSQFGLGVAVLSGVHPEILNSNYTDIGNIQLLKAIWQAANM